MKTFKEFVTEAEQSPLQKEYQAYFNKALKDAGVSSPAELDKEAMKKFFDGISAGWKKGEGEK
jgi:hypothetical protein